MSPVGFRWACGACGCPLQRVNQRWLEFARECAPDWGIELTPELEASILPARIVHTAMVHDSEHELPPLMKS